MMADPETISFKPENEVQFWHDMDETLSAPAWNTLEAIDDALRGWLRLAARLRCWAGDHEDDVAICAHKLLTSTIFAHDGREPTRRDYVRTQMIHSLLEEDDAMRLYVIACFLLLDGRSADEVTFPQMVAASCFPRLLALIGNAYGTPDPALHRLLLELMYEMARMERLSPSDLLQVDDGLVQGLFSVIEGVSDDVNDPYHYPIIRVLLVLNEQYMVASASCWSPTVPLTNPVVKCLSLHGPSFRTFGENIILLLNRETETSLQLLILKLLYLLFTNKATHEYFYTNDLKVLLDVIIRNLMDLPDERMALRHTYLRVLYPLLAHTQLSHPPHYKRDEVLRVIKILRGSGNVHFAPADETTVRLVDRVSAVEWLKELRFDGSDDDEQGEQETGSDPADQFDEGEEAVVARRSPSIKLSPSGSSPSSASVFDVAAVVEKRGVRTPSKKTESEGGIPSLAKKIPPAVPVPRRQRGAAGTCAPTGAYANGQTAKVPPKAPPPRRWGRLKPITTDLAGGHSET